MEHSARRYRDLALLFFRLGTTAFGGPAVHIAMMHSEFVVRRGWLAEGEFLDLLAAANLIPGPSSTELAIYIGYRLGGWRGLLIAGACFILPAACVCVVLAMLYVRFGRLPFTESVLYTIKPVVIAVVIQALVKLGRSAVKTRLVAMVGVVAGVIYFVTNMPLVVLAFAGTVVLLARSARRPGVAMLALPLGQGVTTAASSAAAATGAAPVLGLFLVFLKVGAVLFGSGYVLLAFLQTELVDHPGWLTSGQLLDAIAIGQITPGPVFTTATFIGYVIDGGLGAVAATVGIFLPAFVLVGATSPFLRHLRKSKAIGHFLDGLNVGSLALMAVVTVQLARAALFKAGSWMPDPLTVAIAVAGAVLLLKTKVNSAWLLLGAAAIGAVRPLV